jgi:hypothetical protein
MSEVGICPSLYILKLTTVVQRCSNLVIVLAREDVEVHLHALQSTTEQFQLCEWGHCRLGNCIVVRKMHLITQNVHVFPCSNSIPQLLSVPIILSQPCTWTEESHENLQSR